MAKSKQKQGPALPESYVAQVDDLIPYARNARSHTDSQVAKVAASIQEFGFLAPVVTSDSGILAGHCRIEAARRLGMTQVPAVEASHLTKAQQQAYIIADNRIALDAEWNEQMLALELNDIAEADLDMTITGFEHEELQEILNQSLNLDDQESESKHGAGEGGDDNAEFKVSLDPQQKERVLRAIHAAKTEHDLESTADALMVIVDVFERQGE